MLKKEKKKCLQGLHSCLLFGVGPRLASSPVQQGAQLGPNLLQRLGPADACLPRRKGPWRTSIKEHRKSQFLPMASYTHDTGSRHGSPVLGSDSLLGEQGQQVLFLFHRVLSWGSGVIHAEYRQFGDLSLCSQAALCSNNST